MKAESITLGCMMIGLNDQAWSVCSAPACANLSLAATGEASTQGRKKPGGARQPGEEWMHKAGSRVTTRGLFTLRLGPNRCLAAAR